MTTCEYNSYIAMCFLCYFATGVFLAYIVSFINGVFPKLMKIRRKEWGLPLLLIPFWGLVAGALTIFVVVSAPAWIGNKLGRAVWHFSRKEKYQ